MFYSSVFLLATFSTTPRSRLIFVYLAMKYNSTLAQDYCYYLLALHIILSSLAFLCKSQSSYCLASLGGFEGPEYLAQKWPEQNRFSEMLAKVERVQWCSNAAKLHDNELSSSNTPLRIKEKYHLHEDKKKIVPGSRCPQRPESDRNNRTWREL